MMTKLNDFWKKHVSINCKLIATNLRAGLNKSVQDQKLLSSSACSQVAETSLGKAVNALTQGS